MKDIKMSGPSTDSIVETRIYNADDEKDYDVQITHATFHADHEGNWTIAGTLLNIIEADD